MLPLGVLGEAILRTPREQRRLGRGRDPPAADLLHALLATLPRAPLIRPRSRGDRARRLFRSVVAAAVVEAARRRRRRAAGTALLRFRPTTTARRRRRAASAAGFARDASASAPAPAPPARRARTAGTVDTHLERRVVGSASPRDSGRRAGGAETVERLVHKKKTRGARRRPETASTCEGAARSTHARAARGRRPARPRSKSAVLEV